MALYEFFNTSNQSFPFFEMHAKLMDPPEIPGCGLVQLVHPDLRCKFLKETNHCVEDDKYVPHFQFLYCILGVKTTFQIFLAGLLVLSIVLIIFVILAITADKLFCPCLRVVSHFLGLNESVAGVTLLAFGNCAPELFGTIVRLKEEARVPVSDLYGSCIFVMFFVAGIINFTMPFQLDWFTYLRDAFFLLLGLAAVHHFIKNDNFLSIYEGASLVCLYIGYIIVVIMEQFLIKRKVKQMVRKVSRGTASHIERMEIEEFQRKSYFQYSRYSTFEGFDQLEEIEMTRLAYRDSTQAINGNLFNLFMISFSLFDRIEFNSKGIFGKLFMLISLPLDFLITAFVPIIDYEMDNHGWSKLLNCIQIVVMPFVIISQDIQFELFGLPLYLLSVVVTIPLAVILFLTSRADTPPRIHLLFAFLTLWGSIFLIGICAEEVINLLSVMGVLVYRNNAFLGCTLLALGNSIGDLLANVVLARNGYPIMGYTACFGGPIFNAIFIIGVGAIYKSIMTSYNNMEINFNEGTTGETVYFFAVIGLSVCIFNILLCNFSFRRSAGALLLIMYVIFCIFSTLTEINVIHSFGTAHSHDAISYPVADEINDI